VTASGFAGNRRGDFPAMLEKRMNRYERQPTFFFSRFHSFRHSALVSDCPDAAANATGTQEENE
jgi:hypothetical protein